MGIGALRPAASSAGVWLALQARAARAFVVGSSALALITVPTADLLSDDALALGSAARRSCSRLSPDGPSHRLQVGRLVYLALAAWHVLAVDAPDDALDPAEATRAPASPSPWPRSQRSLPG